MGWRGVGRYHMEHRSGTPTDEADHWCIKRCKGAPLVSDLAERCKDVLRLLPVAACYCLLLLAAASCCQLLPAAAACCCLLPLPAACCCLLLPAVACCCAQLPAAD